MRACSANAERMEKLQNGDISTISFLYLEVYEELRAQIERGDLLPDDHLPSEEDLVETYSVSRITVKKALERLREDGLIYRVQGSGTFVSGTVPAEQRTEEVSRPHRLIGIVLKRVSSSFGLKMMYYRCNCSTTRAARPACGLPSEAWKGNLLRSMILYP